MRSSGLPPDLLQVRAPAINFYVFKDRAGLVLLDSGFIGGKLLLRRALQRAGWEQEPIVGIIVTHGHLDHILNVAAIAESTGAWIAAPRKDAIHYAGEPVYEGWAQVTGLLETIGRPVLGFKSFKPDRWLEDGDRLEVWHGLQAVHLPGHTDGHMGFYCESLRVMFTSDLFASYSPLQGRIPPDIFNSNPSMIPASLNKALEFDLVGVIPNHCDRESPSEHLRRLHRLRASI